MTTMLPLLRVRVARERAQGIRAHNNNYNSCNSNNNGYYNSSNAKIPKDLETSPPRRNLARERGGRTRAKERGKASHQREKESGLPQHHLGGGTLQMAIREKGTKVTEKRTQAKVQVNKARRIPLPLILLEVAALMPNPRSFVIKMRRRMTRGDI